MLVVAGLAVALPGAFAASNTLFGTISAGDPDGGRVVADDPASTCGNLTTASAASGTNFNYDLWTFTNTTQATQCVTLTLDPMGCTNLHSAAYDNPPGYNPANATQNYVGDSGAVSTSPKTYSVPVQPSTSAIDVTVQEVTGGGVCANYALSVSGNFTYPFDFDGGINGSDPVASRLVADDPATTCSGATTAATAGGGSVFHYDKYTFTINSGVPECVTVVLDPMTCSDLQSATYTPSFNPANPMQNYLGDIGATSGSSKQYIVSVPVNANFDVIVNETTADAGCAGYHLSVSGNEVTPPTAVGLAAFSAVRQGKNVTLRWRGTAEARTLGYNVYRSAGAARVRVNSRLILSSRKAGLTVYSWTDRAPNGANRYWLEQVRLDGTKTLRGPVRVSGR